MNGVETKKIMDGKSLKGPFIEAGIEFQKNSAGWRFMFGISPSEIIVNPDNLSLFEVRHVNFNSNYIDANRVCYFGKGNSIILPLGYGGLGFIKCIGDIKNVGVSINFGAGIIIKLMENFFIEFGLDGKIPYFIDFREPDTMNRTIHFFDPAAYLDISYLFK